MMSILFKNKSYNLIYIFFFFIFLYPFSISLSNEDGASANYSYVLFPVLYFLYNYKITKPSNFWLNVIFFYTLIFLISSIYQYNYYIFFNRRLVSFLIFLFIFSFLFVRYNIILINSFKISLVVVSLFFSISTLYKYANLGGADIGAAAKGLVGSQRFGFVYVMAIWILILNTYKSILKNIIKYSLLFLITVGLFLTFSRSGIIAMIISYFLFSLYNFLKWLKRPNFRSLIYSLLAIISIFSIIFYINIYFPEFLDFFNSKLFSYFESKGSENIDLDIDSSEGYRVYMLGKVLNFVLFNPITGSGFLGVWILFQDLSGSAHGQFVDVVFRTGILGFILYLYLIFLVLTKLFKHNKDLFWGTIGVLFYGFFHETFKTSHGSFIFAFLIGYTANYKSEHNPN